MMKLTRTTTIPDVVPGASKLANLTPTTSHSTSSTMSTTTSSSPSRAGAGSLVQQDHDSDSDDNVFVMSPQVAQTVVAKTKQRVADFLQKSPCVRIQSEQALAQIPRFDATDLVLGKQIAEGGFSNIHEITSLKTTTGTTNIKISGLTGNNNLTSPQFVVKHLKPHLALNPHRLRSAAKDILNELHVLSCLDHRNIIQVRGLSSAGIAGMEDTGRADSFFLLFDRMESSLLHKLSLWRSKGIRQQSLDLKRLGKCESTTQLFVERLRVAQQLASAVAYLHQRRILHRDIKPGNVCFDAKDGNVKLIDFGLAVELPSDYDETNAAHRYDVGNAGTARYQAPEIISKKPYNTKSESYSLSIVVWEMIALTRPFDCLSGEEVKQSVAQIGFRPPISRSWPRTLKSLLKRGWSKSTTQRPNMAEMELTLTKIADEAPLLRHKKKTSWWC